MTKFRWPDHPRWSVVGVCAEGDPIPDFPKEIWQLEWRNTSRAIQVSDPRSGNQHSLSVMDVETNQGTITFAVTEVSNGAYLFALPRTP